MKNFERQSLFSLRTPAFPCLLITSSAGSHANIIFVPSLSRRFTKDSSEHIGMSLASARSRQNNTLLRTPGIHLRARTRETTWGEREREEVEEEEEEAIKKKDGRPATAKRAASSPAGRTGYSARE